MPPHPTKFRIKVARTQDEIDAAQRLRFQSFAGGRNISIAFDPRVRREIAAVDLLPSSYHVVVCQAETVVGAARLALPNADVALGSGTTFGFELENGFVLDGLRRTRGLAEVARVVVAPAFRCTAAVARLYEGLYCLSRELGVKTWLGGVNCQTTRADEAALMRTVLQGRGLVDERFEVVRRSPEREVPQGAADTRFYSPSERQRAEARLDGVRIASTLSHFCRRLGARCIGRPARYPAFFPWFALPMLVELDELPASTLAKFDLSTLGPSLPAAWPPAIPGVHAHGLEAGRHAS